MYGYWIVPVSDSLVLLAISSFNGRGDALFLTRQSPLKSTNYIRYCSALPDAVDI